MSMQAISNLDPTSQEKLSDCLQRLEYLQLLKSNGLLTEDEFDERRSQIVDQLTGTTSGTTGTSVGSTRKNSSTRKFSTRGSSVIATESESRRADTRTRRRGGDGARPAQMPQIQVVPHPPPDWGTVRVEKAIRYDFDYETRNWIRSDCRVKIDTMPFAKGGLRLVFHLQDQTQPKLKHVAKMSMDPRDNEQRDIYFNDVRMQAIAKHFSKRYNRYEPPKKVTFLDAWVLELVQREGSPVCGVEPFIEGEYKKYNNNMDWVSDEDRNTPQAFAHYTYEASNHELLVCDIQGVQDVYTDPQVHTAKSKKDFGKGNLGEKGFEHFMRTHRCNVLCKYLKLPNINKLPIPVNGTMPQNTHIPYNAVSYIGVDFHQPTMPMLGQSQNQQQEFPQLLEESARSDHVWILFRLVAWLVHWSGKSDEGDKKKRKRSRKRGATVPIGSCYGKLVARGRNGSS